MKKRRLIPTLLYRNGQLVQSREFKSFRNIGNPFKAVERFSDWDADELIYLDISDSNSSSIQRTDLRSNFHGNPIELLREIAKFSSMPITFGGGIKSLNNIADRIYNGADKVSVNSLLFSNPQIIVEAIREFGGQAIVASVDVYYVESEAFALCRSIPDLKIRLTEHISLIRDLGVGEVLLNSVDRDGMKSGYDISLINTVVDKLGIPVIALGGAGNWDHLSEVFLRTNADAVSAANIFHWEEQSVNQARRHLYSQGHNIRPPLT